MIPNHNIYYKQMQSQQFSMIDELNLPPSLSPALQKILQNEQEPLNKKYKVSIISFYYEYYLTSVLVLFSLAHLLNLWQSNFEYRVYPIMLLLIFLSFWDRPSANTFSCRIPAVCLFQHLLHFSINVAKTWWFYQTISVILIIAFVCLVVSYQELEQFRRTSQIVRSVWVCLFLLLGARFKFYSQYSDGDRISYVQFVFVYEVLGALCAFISCQTQLTPKKLKSNQFLSLQIHYSQLLRIAYLPHYTNIPSLLLLLLIIQCFFQIRYKSTQKFTFILNDYTTNNSLALQLYSNTIKIYNNGFTNISQVKRRSYYSEQQIDDELCFMCEVNAVDMVLIECMHTGLCGQCAKKQQLKLKKRNLRLQKSLFCPICNEIRSTEKRLQIVSLNKYFKNKQNISKDTLSQDYYHYREIVQGRLDRVG